MVDPNPYPHPPHPLRGSAPHGAGAPPECATKPLGRTGQLQMFPLSMSLTETTLAQRQAAAEQVLDQEATSLGDREELLALVCWPAAWSEVER